MLDRKNWSLPLQCSCLQNPRDGRAWWAAVSGVSQSRTRLSDLAAAAVILHLTFSVSKLEVEIVRLEEQTIKRALKQPQCMPLGDTLAPVSHQRCQPQWSARKSWSWEGVCFTVNTSVLGQVGKYPNRTKGIPPAAVTFFHICLVFSWFLLQSWFLHSDSWLFSLLQRYSFLVSLSIDHLLINKLHVLMCWLHMASWLRSSTCTGALVFLVSSQLEIVWWWVLSSLALSCHCPFFLKVTLYLSTLTGLHSKGSLLPPPGTQKHYFKLLLNSASPRLTTWLLK